MLRNISFICPCCREGSDLLPSVLTLQGNYGSREHDTERATIKLCGGCFDKLYAVIQSNLPEDAIEIDFSL